MLRLCHGRGARHSRGIFTLAWMNQLMSDLAWKWARSTDCTHRTLVINAVLCTALFGTWSAVAQTTTPANFVWEEFSDRISKTEKVTALGPDLFGDNVRLANGELGFEITDITLPGNNALEVKLTRTYDVVSRKTYTPDAMLADWQIKVPHISGSYAQDWGTGTDAGRPLVLGEVECRLGDPRGRLGSCRRSR